MSKRSALCLHLTCCGLDLGFRGQLGLLDIRFVGPNGGFGGTQRGDGGVQILFCCGVLFDQRLEAIVILLSFYQIGLRLSEVGLGLEKRNLALGEAQVGLGLAQVPFGLRDLGLIRPEVQHIKRLAGFDFLAGPEQPFLNVAVHAGTDFDHVSREGLGGIVGVNIGVR